MRYLPEQKVTFIHNPKTAGTSISAWLDQNFVTKQGRKHGNYLEVEEFFPNTQTTFGVVRNPWARLVSWYNFANNTNEHFAHWLVNRLNTQQPAFHSNLMWARQWYTLGTPQHQWLGSHCKILKYETLLDDFDYIQNLLGCNKPLPMLNCNEQVDYRTYYTDDLAEFVRDVFLKDVIEYDYEF